MLSVETKGRVMVATLSRPPVNAINDSMIASLDEAIDRAVADETISVLHVRSDQKVFSAGADLALMQSCFTTPEGPDAMIAVVRRMQALFARLELAPIATFA